MQVCVCKICKKQYISRTKGSCCDECKSLNEMVFERVENYLVQFPNSNAMQISSGLDIPIETVLAYIDEGRLGIVKGHFEKLD